MAGPGYSNIFGGGSILPSWPAYLAIDLTADQVLQWPTEVNSGNGAIVAEILEVTAAAAGLTIQLSSALEVGLGYSFLVNNVGADTFSLLDNAGGTIAAIASGEVWQIYCADNSTAAGTWRVFQYGAGVSTANAAALAGAGLKAVGSLLNERIFVNAQGVNYTIQNSDRAALVEWTGAGGGAFTLPNPATVGSDWFCYIKNSGGAALTVTPAAGSIDSSASATFQINNSAIIVCDGVNFWTIGFGQSLSSSFNFVTINLGGLSGTYTLAGANLNRISYKFIGALAGNLQVVVPASIQQYWVSNGTTGAYTLTFASSGAGGATVTVPQGTNNILYCDGLNIVQAVYSAATTPQFPDGSAAAPGITFTSDTGMGLYKAGTDILGIATAGVSRGTVNATGNWSLPAATFGTTFTVAGGIATDTIGIGSGNGYPNFLVFKAATTARTNTTVLTADPDLKLVFPVTGTYRIRGLLLVNGYIGANEGITLSPYLTGGATTGPTDTRFMSSVSGNQVSPLVSVTNTLNGAGGPGFSTNAPTGVDLVITVDAVIQITTVGTWGINWAPTVVNANPVNMLNGSYLEMEKIA